MVDDEDLHRLLSRLQLEPELLLNSVENCWTIASVARLGPGDPFQFEIVDTLEPGHVDDRPISEVTRRQSLHLLRYVR